jgi:hypothetical protein
MDRLSGETIYYDRATVLRQLGVFHEPDSAAGRIATVLMRPLSMVRIVGGRSLAGGSQRDKTASPSPASPVPS